MPVTIRINMHDRSVPLSKEYWFSHCRLGPHWAVVGALLLFLDAHLLKKIKRALLLSQNSLFSSGLSITRNLRQCLPYTPVLHCSVYFSTSDAFLGYIVVRSSSLIGICFSFVSFAFVRYREVRPRLIFYSQVPLLQLARINESPY